MYYLNNVLVWGAPDVWHGANGSWINVFEKLHPTHVLSIRSGILQEYCAALMKDFFLVRRLEKAFERQLEELEFHGKT